MSRTEPMSVSELRAAIKGVPGDADVFAVLPGGRMVDVASITYQPADPTSVINAEPSITIWIEEA